MYYVSAQGVDERMINVHYYYVNQEAKQMRNNSTQCSEKLTSYMSRVA